MDMQTMKHVDRFAGNPLCVALRLLDMARPRGEDAGVERKLEELMQRSRPGAKGPPPEIAVIKFWGMGSLILAAPLFHALRKTHPRARISLITLAHNRGIIELLGIADRVYFLELGGTAPSVAAKIVSFLGEVKSAGPDAVIDLEYLTRFSAIVSCLSGAQVRAGFHSWDAWRGNLHNLSRAFNPYWHVTGNFLNLHAALGADAGEIEPVRIRLDGGEDEEASAMLTSAGIGPDERVVAVNTNASTMALARRWPGRSFAELIDRIVEAGLGRVVLLGAPDEARMVEDVHRQIRRAEEVKSLAGKSSLRGLVGILRRADLLVTNDSGPLHLADTLGTPTVSFFGPETPALFGPRGPQNLVLYRSIDCSPCISIYNAKTVRCMRALPECLTGISVDEAFAAVRRALGESR